MKKKRLKEVTFNVLLLTELLSELYITCSTVISAQRIGNKKKHLVPS